MMSRIRIKNFGPIRSGYQENDGWIEIKKVTLFIGNQGSGKSTIAKLISTFTWLEKALTRGDYEIRDFEKKDVLRRYLQYHSIDNYFVYEQPGNRKKLTIKEHDLSEIAYEGESYSFVYKDRRMKINAIIEGNYPLPQIMYVPADRNFLSALEDRKTQRVVSPALRELLDEMDKAQRDLDQELDIPINSLQLEYNKTTDLLYVKGSDYTIKLSESSSGLQSFVPLYLVTRYLTNTINRQSTTNEPMNSDQLGRFKQGVAEIYGNPNLTYEQRRAALSALSAVFNKSAFINIVEEPEQNLFPSSQWEVLKSLLQFNNVNKGNKLVMTTHSPYIINYLSIIIEGKNLNHKLEDSKKVNYLKNKLNKIVPFDSLVEGKDVFIYQLNEKDGSICLLPNFEGIPTDKNYLNSLLKEGNQIFDSLLALEEEI